ncbi:MAG TPA: hypothetical protein VNZ26_04585 [Vicinamibacterales bacterium]|nr:hypothetical protein [Vicinamibacterales bacterium]
MFKTIRVSILHLALATAIVAVSVAPAAAQNEGALRAFFEGKRVALRIDMPGSSDGVDVHANANQAVDYPRYRDNLKRYGTAIHSGDSITVTLVKVKKDLIEFQLGGGGYGTFGDDTSTSVYIPDAPKTEREKQLERLIHDEDDRAERKKLEAELDDVKDRRERENRRIATERERQSEAKAVAIADRRLHGGSRFNLRYDDRVPNGIRPEDVMAALTEYVDFGSIVSASLAPSGVTRDEPPPTADITQLRKGLTRGDAERLFGRPAETSERRDGGLTVTTLVFVAGDQRISADFVEDVLVRYTVSSK